MTSKLSRPSRSGLNLQYVTRAISDRLLERTDSGPSSDGHNLTSEFAIAPPVLNRLVPNNESDMMDIGITDEGTQLSKTTEITVPSRSVINLTRGPYAPFTLGIGATQYPFRPSNRKVPQLRFLPLCTWSKSHMRLFHVKIRLVNESTEDDETLFRRMLEIYNQERGLIRRIFSWWQLRKAERVKV